MFELFEAWARLISSKDLSAKLRHGYTLTIIYNPVAKVMPCFPLGSQPEHWLFYLTFQPFHLLSSIFPFSSSKPTNTLTVMNFPLYTLFTKIHELHMH